MLPTTNRTVTIYAITTSGNKRVFAQTGTARAYINQNGEETLEGPDGDAAYTMHKMLTDGNHAAIEIGSRLTDDQGATYDVRGKAAYADVTGKHHQYVLAKAHT